MNFHVGQKVVCVDAKADHRYLNWLPDETIYEGKIYTITSIHPDREGDLVVWLEGVHRSAKARKQWGEKCGYCIRRFRPLVTRKTDISIFKRMLIPAPEKVRA